MRERYQGKRGTRCRREQAKINLDKIDGVVWTTSIYIPIESVREIE